MGGTSELAGTVAVAPVAVAPPAVPVADPPPPVPPVAGAALDRRPSRPWLPPLLPARTRAHRAPRWWEEVVVIGFCYWLYSLVRNGVPTHQAAALRRATGIQHLERTLHLDPELAVNRAIASVHWLAITANYYYATLHFVVTLGVLAWLYRRHPVRYRSVRSVLYGTNLVALVGFWTFPLAPPRMLTSSGYIDTVAVFHTWGSYASGDIASASNQFAAMPSLHIGWALWSGIALVRLSPTTWVRVLGALYPFVTLAVIVATANHFVLDAVGGAVVLAAGFGIQRLLSGRPAFEAATGTA